MTAMLPLFISLVILVLFLVYYFKSKGKGTSKIDKIISKSSSIEDETKPSEISQKFHEYYEKNVGKSFLCKILNGFIDFDILKTNLHYAGRHQRANVSEFIFIKLIMIIAGLATVLFLVMGTSLPTTNPVVLFIVIASVILLSLYMPDILLKVEIRQYHEKIRRALPTFITLVNIAVRAGYSVDNSIHEAAITMQKQHPEFAKEMLITHRELSMATDRSSAWHAMLNRTNLLEFEALIDQFVRSEQLGAGLIEPLRLQAEKTRKLVKMYIDRKIERLPILLSVAIVVILIPVLIIFVGGVAYFNVASSLGAFVVS